MYWQNIFRKKVPWLIWVLFIVAVGMIVGLQTLGMHTVTPAYMLGSEHWMHGEDLYDHSGRGFIYLPQAALLFIPFARLASFSFPLAEVIWRSLSLSLLAIAIYRSTRSFDRSAKIDAFLIITLLTVPLALSSARNGQFNIIMIALMLFTVAAIYEEKYWQAMFCLVLGIALKPTMVVFLLLVTALYRPLWWKVAFGLLLLLLFPFLFQHGRYVFSQYLNCMTMLREAVEVGFAQKEWAQIFALFDCLHVSLALKTQTLVRLIFAFFTLYCGMRAKKNYGKFAIFFLYMLAAYYLLLFNPRTENNDYVFLGPAIGFYVCFLLQQKFFSKIELGFVVAIGVLLNGTYPPLGGIHYDIWSSPLLAIVMGVKSYLKTFRIFVTSQFFN